jgi:hypothetical protein
MWKHPSAPGPAVREVIGAWLVCLVVAAGCFTLLAAAAPVPNGPAKALIGPGPAATVAAAGADRADAHRHGRC